MPKVSVVIPVYNAQQFLDETLTSLRRQNLEDIEVLCVDDGSTDQSREILTAVAAEDPRFRVLEKTNGGVGSARNLGLASATGEYLSFIDSDDVVSEDYLEQLYASTSPEKPDIVVTGNVLEYWPDGSKNSRNVGVKEETILTTPAEKAPIVTATGLTQNKIYRTAFIRDIGLQHYSGKSVSEDNYFTICSVALAGTVKTVLKGTYLYRQRPHSITKTRKRPDDLSMYDVYEKARSFALALAPPSDDAREWEGIITQRQQIDLTNYHYDLPPPDRAKFRALAKRMTEGRIRIPPPRNESRAIIKSYIKSALGAVGLYHPSR